MHEQCGFSRPRVSAASCGRRRWSKRALTSASIFSASSSVLGVPDVSPRGVSSGVRWTKARGSRRRHGVTGRLLGIQRSLAGRPWRDDQQAAELSERIVVFNAEASARALPAASE